MPRSPSRLPKDSKVLMGLSAGSTIVLAQLATNAFTPAFPQLVVSLHSSPRQVQLTVSAYLAGYALTQLFCGPLSEVLGRRKVLLAALLIFVAGNLGCAASPSLGWLLLFLFLTSLGAGGLPSVSQSIMRDMYGPQEITRVMSYLVTALAITPIVAPLVGGHIAFWLGWRNIFLLIAVAGGALLTIVFFLLRETNLSCGQRFLPREVGRVYLGLLGQRSYMGYALLLGFSVSQFVLLYSGAPFIFQYNLHMTPNQYGWWFLIFCLGYPLGSVWSRSIIKKLPLPRVGRLGVGLCALGSGAGALISWAVGPSLVVLVLCNLVFSLGLGICITVGKGGALAVIKSNIGFGTGLMGFVATISGALINTLGSRLNLVHHQKVAVSMFICAALAWAALGLVRQDPEEAQEPDGPGA